MSRVAIEGNPSGSGTLTIAAPNTDTDRTLTLPDNTGTVLVGGSPSSSTTNTVTNKIAVVINGTTYYLLASTSGT
jgi:hypothetical protein